jgi:hypothetical protein
MQMIGGQANVLAADFRNWFTGLWQGEALAKTVIVLTVGVTLVFRFVALNPGTAAEIPADETPPRENIKP